MTEKIKQALKIWAEDVLKNQAQWDTVQLHQAIQTLYELSVCQKILMDENSPSTDLWKRQQVELSSVLETLTGPLQTKKIDTEDSLEVPPMMETIKNMVTEMPESENYELLFNAVEEPPIFIPKDEQGNKVNQNEVAPPLHSEERKNLNDHFTTSLTIDLNDRLAFIKHLFEENVSDYEAVISQIVTYETWDEVLYFIDTKVKIEYPHWKDKEDIKERFMTILKNNFNAN